MRRSTVIILIAAVIAIAAGLRLWGITWGLPTAKHYFSYHPDETTILLSAMKVDVFSGQLDPEFYNYGSLFIYLVNIAAVLGSLLGWISFTSSNLFAQIGEFAKLYLAGRLIAVGLGVLTVYLVYRLGRKAYGAGAGLLAALFVAVMPLHVMDSKFMTVDVPATFFVVLSLLFAVRIADGHRFRDYLFAGLFAGLAAGTKYNAGLVILAPIAAHLSSDKARRLIRPFSPKLLVTLMSGALGFLIGTPGALLNTGRFVHDFRHELGHAKSGHGLLFVDTGSGFVYQVTHSLLPGMGLPLLVLAGIGLMCALRKRSPADVAMLAFLAAYYLVIGAARVRFARYCIPILPVLALFSARFCADLIQKLHSGGWFSRVFGYVFGIVLVGVVGYTLFFSLAIDRTFAATDTRDRAADWIAQHIEFGSKIAMPTVPWFYTPPVDPEFGLPRPDERYESVTECIDYDLVVSETTEWDADFLKRESPDVVLLSEFEYEDRVRLDDPSARAYFDVLNADYTLTRRFADRPSLFGMRVPWVGELPHDMSYVSPTILIYQRKAG